MPRLESWITWRVNGVVPVKVPTESSRPDGTLWNVRFTVFGWSCTLTVFSRPPESVAVSRSSRKAGYSWSGASTVPWSTPSKLW